MHCGNSKPIGLILGCEGADTPKLEKTIGMFSVVDLDLVDHSRIHLCSSTALLGRPMRQFCMVDNLRFGKRSSKLVYF